MQYCKLQIGCLIVLTYIAFIYFLECRQYKKNLKESFFDELLILSIITTFFDGATAYTVNHLDTVNPVLNLILHMLFFVGLDSVIFTLFLYILRSTCAFKRWKKRKKLIYLPFAVSILLVVGNIGSLRYVEGKFTNYSMGISVYACFIMIGVYIILSIAVFFKRLRYIESNKRLSIFTYLFVMTVVTGFQIVFPEALITSIGVTLFILGIYMNQENPALGKLSRFHSEMVMGFANLIENRDDSTGGHVKRTSMYVKLIAEELRDRGFYSNVLSTSYIENLLKAAPMHDVGKISVPDAILQKPGKLTDEEFEIMKLHAENGGKVIKKSFRNLGNHEYLRMAYEVARHHHEKWNGKGYPDGLKEKNIPLCARIMAVADVFDAISEKRCYREAMPMDKCFEIIEKGSGQDFDPIIAYTFLEIRDKVEQVHADFAASNGHTQ
ncbi:MAG: HD domain-containing protein [Oscillospiraceae bacterium]|nr:HD domain-containing protein [Oscillospiraceae bacterium]